MAFLFGTFGVVSFSALAMENERAEGPPCSYSYLGLSLPRYPYVFLAILSTFLDILIWISLLILSSYQYRPSLLLQMFLLMNSLLA